MESPVVLDKPPENYANERGFPFDEEEGSDAWSDLLVRHPELAARLRPATWARKRRPSSQDGIDDSGDNFRSFDRFPFNNIPAEFREHFPSEWVDFSPREEQQRQQPPPSPQHQTAATQTETEAEAEAGPSQENTQAPLPQYGLRNTVDLGQKSPADPSIVDAEDRSQRCMSAPPDNRTVNPNCGRMSGQGSSQEHTHQHQEAQSNVRHIPIFVEGRDEPVINKNVDYTDPKPTYVPPPQPHVDREQYYADDGPTGFAFSKSFDRPFFRQGTQPFTKQKMYPQAAFARGASPQRSQSPKPAFHEQHVPRTETPSRPLQKQAPPPQPQRQSPPQYKQAPPQRHTTPPPPPPQAHQQSPPPEPAPQQQAPSANDPITRILSIQTDVLNLMTDVENFTGAKKDKRYIYLDEMLTRNLIKLDNIETDGKENIRQARKEAIKCIQKCIAVLEAKADNKGVTSPQPAQDVEMQVTENRKPAESQEVVQNGDVEMKESTKEEPSVESASQEQPQPEIPVESNNEAKKVETAETKLENIAPAEATSSESSEVVDTRADDNKGQETDTLIKPQDDTQGAEKKSPKKTVKKRDKSKDKKKAPKDKESEESAESQDIKDKKEDINKKEDENENIVNKNETNDVCVNNKIEDMQVDAKGDKKDSQSMEVDGGASH